MSLRCTELAQPLSLQSGFSPVLSPYSSSPFPFSFVLLFSLHRPPLQHLSWTAQPHARETLQTQRLFQRQPRGPQGSSPPNQTPIGSFYANRMCLDVGAPLAHGADKQKHMAEPGRARTSAAAPSWGLGEACNQQHPSELQRALPGCEVPHPCLQQGCA